ncbi:GNAT family N-acetyltransferase [Micrococcus sp. HG099]|uniref:bifunctional acetate--CoA ligase family protein/GNAT family N-acetyltransferase n=1 Tax=Micrococcus sp. HG099 TaxID=2969755 RepID=UPI00215B65F4|nr:GNAT family N-acetyltransferase [Micrococcus sp. HG099]MCR8674876.1 GNAT family N-acetyltransferase [Micrococcus sp. HG099]
MGDTEPVRDYPSHWEADVVLRDGATARLRPITPEDAAELQRMHAGQSETSIYLRYFTYKSELSAKDLDRFTHVDHKDRVAFVITRGGRLLGVGRYDRYGDSDAAEVAFNISDAAQGRGLGSILMEHLAVAAREHGIRRFTAEVLPENRKMLSVFQESGFEVTRRFEDGVVAVEFPIDPTARWRAVVESREHRAEARSVAELVAPESVAVVGASRDPQAVGSMVLRHILEGGFTGPVHAVNRAAGEVQGLTAHASLAEIGEEVELVVVAVPVDQVEALVPEAGAAGAAGLLVLTSGYADAGAEGLEAQRRLVSLARAHGMRVIGPASAGLVRTDPAVRLNASPYPGLAQRGPVGLFSQSGAVGAMVSAGAKRRGVGVSTSISAGNRADVSGNDAMQFFEADPHTAAVGVYLESFGNPRKFTRITRRLSRTKPVVVVRSDVTGRFLPPGHETRTTQAPEGAVDSMLDQTGVLEVHTHEAMLDLLMAVASQPLPTGRRVVLVADSLAVDRLARDAAAEAGLDVVATVGLAGSEQGVAPPAETLVASVREAVAHEQADAVVVVGRLGLHQEDDDPETVARALAEATAGARMPVLVCLTDVVSPRYAGATLGASGPVADDAEPGSLQPGVPFYPSPQQAMSVLGALADYVRWRGEDAGEPLEPADVRLHAAEDLVEAAAASAEGTELVRLSPAETEELLGHYGIAVLPSARFETADEAVAAAERLGFPVAVKAVDPHLRHRLDLGGVRLNVVDADSLRRNVEQMRRVLAPFGVTELEVQAMAPAGQACMVTALEDPLLGPVVSFGIAGDATDLLGDWVHRVPPLTDRDVARMVRAPRAAAKLEGGGGVPAVDLAALEDLVGRVSVLKDDLPQVARLRFSPVLASPEGVTVLQAEVDVANAAGRTDSARRALRGS